MPSTEAVLSDAQLNHRLAAELPHWYVEGGTLRRRWSSA
jgi:hypothetical protein